MIPATARDQFRFVFVSAASPFSLVTFVFINKMNKKLVSVERRGIKRAITHQLEVMPIFLSIGTHECDVMNFFLHRQLDNLGLMFY